MAGAAEKPLQVYFLGELGVFVQFALGLFERYFEGAPDARVDILTFPDFGKLLQHLFPQNVTVTTYDGPPLSAHRFGIGLMGDYPGAVDRLVSGRVDISVLARRLGISRPLYFARQPLPQEPPLQSLARRGYAALYTKLRNHSGPYFPVLNISKPITVPPAAAPPRNVMLLPRMRDVPGGRDRNLEAGFWNTLIREHLAPACDGRRPLYVCGLPEERVTDLSGEGLVAPKGDLLDEVRLLNNCALLICPLSGYGQLASFCGTDVLYVLPPERVSQEDRHIASLTQSNIFGTEVRFVRQTELLANPRLALDAIAPSREEAGP